MGGMQRRKQKGTNLTHHHTHKTKHYLRDLDQRHEDNQDKNKQKFQKMEVNEELPGLGQFYCVPCARYFINQKHIDQHVKENKHKRMVKLVKEKPYTIEESELYGK